MLAAPHDDFPFPHSEVHWPDVEVIKRPHQYFLFDVKPVLDLAGQWEAHAIRNRYSHGYGHMLDRIDKNAPIAKTAAGTQFVAAMRKEFN